MSKTEAVWNGNDLCEELLGNATVQVSGNSLVRNLEIEMFQESDHYVKQ